MAEGSKLSIFSFVFSSPLFAFGVPKIWNCAEQRQGRGGAPITFRCMTSSQYKSLIPDNTRISLEGHIQVDVVISNSRGPMQHVPKSAFRPVHSPHCAENVKRAREKERKKEHGCLISPFLFSSKMGSKYMKCANGSFLGRKDTEDRLS